MPRFECKECDWVNTNVQPYRNCGICGAEAVPCMVTKGVGYPNGSKTGYRCINCAACPRDLHYGKKVHRLTSTFDEQAAIDRVQRTLMEEIRKDRIELERIKRRVITDDDVAAYRATRQAEADYLRQSNAFRTNLNQALTGDGSGALAGVRSSLKGLQAGKEAAPGMFDGDEHPSAIGVKFRGGKIVPESPVPTGLIASAFHFLKSLYGELKADHDKNKRRRAAKKRNRRLFRRIRCWWRMLTDRPDRRPGDTFTVESNPWQSKLEREYWDGKYD